MLVVLVQVQVLVLVLLVQERRLFHLSVSHGLIPLRPSGSGECARPTPLARGWIAAPAHAVQPELGSKPWAHPAEQSRHVRYVLQLCSVL